MSFIGDIVFLGVLHELTIIWILHDLSLWETILLYTIVVSVFWNAHCTWSNALVSVFEWESNSDKKTNLSLRFKARWYKSTVNKIESETQSEGILDFWLHMIDVMTRIQYWRAESFHSQQTRKCSGLSFTLGLFDHWESKGESETLVLEESLVRSI